MVEKMKAINCEKKGLCSRFHENLFQIHLRKMPQNDSIIFGKTPFSNSDIFSDFSLKTRLISSGRSFKKSKRFFKKSKRFN